MDYRVPDSLDYREPYLLNSAKRKLRNDEVMQLIATKTRKFLKISFNSRLNYQIPSRLRVRERPGVRT